MHDPMLANRLRIAVSGENNRQIAERVGMNPETVRRYMNGYSPSVEFIGAICRQYGVLGSWLLIGEGPRTREEFSQRLLAEARTDDVLEALADRLNRLEQRLSEIDTLVRHGRSREMLPDRLTGTHG